MAGYSGTPLWKKLGYKDGATAFVEGAPARYRAMLALPSDITEDLIRKLALPLGLVDIKVCRFSDTHTAEKYVVPVSRRQRQETT